MQMPVDRGPHRRVTALQHLSDVLSDPSVSAARKDKVAIALLSVLARQGGLGKKVMAELAARNAGNDPSSGWYDPEFGNLLAAHGGRSDPEAERKAREHKAQWDRLINRQRPAPDDWIDPATGRSDLEFRPYEGPESPDDE